MADVALRGLHDLPERRPRDSLQLARPATPGARLDRGTRLGSISVAVFAQLDGLVAHLHARAARRVRQIDLGGNRDIAALHRPTPGPTAKDVSERAPGAERAGAA